MLTVRTEILNPVIKVKYHVPGMPDIKQAHEGEWYDLYTAERVVMHPGDFRIIPLGVSIELPEGYEAIVAPRSSTFRRYGVINPGSIGVIDHAYKGDNDIWQFPAYCLQPPGVKSWSLMRRILWYITGKKATCDIPQFTRICQFRILRQQPDCEIQRVEQLGNPDRGGIGSTGRC